MRWLSKLLLRVRSLFGKAALDRELDDEVRFHIERQIEVNLAAGMSPEEARRAALADFGGVEHIKEECRDERRVTPIHDLVKDLRFGLRLIRKNPGFTAVAVLILAAGIGANTAVFSFVDAIMLRSLPVRDPDQLVILDWRAQREPDTRMMMSHGDCNGIETMAFARTPSGAPGAAGCSFSLPFFHDLQGHGELYAGVIGFTSAPPLLVSGTGAPAMAGGQLVSGDYFATLGVRAALGRTLQPDDDERSAAVVVLSHAYWQRALGGDPAAVGRTLTLNGTLFTVVGVAEPSFTRFTPGRVIDMWLPLSARRQVSAHWDARNDQEGAWWLTIVARLRPDVPAAQVAAAASLLFRNHVIAGEGPLLAAADAPEVLAVPAASGITGSRVQYQRHLVVLMTAVGLILLIACANVAGLLLARAGSRRREIAVRLALGAGRGRVIRQLLAESLLLALIGGALGVILAEWGVQAMVAFLTTGDARPLGFEIGVDARVLGFTFAVSLLVGVGFGLAPAFRGTRVELAAALKDGAAGSGLGPRARLGGVLVVFQVALSILVLVGAGLLVRTLDKLRAVDPGIRTRNVVLFNIDPSLAGYQRGELGPLYGRLRDELAALPGVTSASWSDVRLLAGSLWTTTLRFPAAPERGAVATDVLGVGPGFFETYQIPVVAGRAFAPEEITRASEAFAAVADTDAVPPGIIPALVNQELVRRHFGEVNPLGARFQYQTDHEASPTWEIVGVVRDTQYTDLRRGVHPAIYLPGGGGGVSFEVVTASPPSALIPDIRRVVERVAPKLALEDVTTQSEAIDRTLFRERLMARLGGLFAGLALALACIGLYALLSYEVGRRTRELGIRMALGAQRADVRRMVVKQGLALTLCGVALGIAGSLAVTRYLQSMLYGVGPADPVVLVGVSALLLLVALAASYLPARRATRVDPMVVLRSE